jgi:hypothetical protein
MRPTFTIRKCEKGPTQPDRPGGGQESRRVFHPVDEHLSLQKSPLGEPLG